MGSLEGGGNGPLAGVRNCPESSRRRVQSRCVRCRRFARLLPGEARCARCSGVLALEFPANVAAGARVRGGQ
jgi:hypothetical protein